MAPLNLADIVIHRMAIRISGERYRPLRAFFAIVRGELLNYCDSAFNSSFPPQRRLLDGLKTVVGESFEVETQVWSMTRDSCPTVRCQELFSYYRNFILSV